MKNDLTYQIAEGCIEGYPVLTSMGISGTLLSVQPTTGVHVVADSSCGLVCYLQPRDVLRPLKASVNDIVLTQYGDGKLTRFRAKDDRYEIELSWGAKLYAQAESFDRDNSGDEVRGARFGVDWVFNLFFSADNNVRGGGGSQSTSQRGGSQQRSRSNSIASVRTSTGGVGLELTLLTTLKVLAGLGGTKGELGVGQPFNVEFVGAAGASSDGAIFLEGTPLAVGTSEVDSTHFRLELEGVGLSGVASQDITGTLGGDETEVRAHDELRTVDQVKVELGAVGDFGRVAEHTTLGLVGDVLSVVLEHGGGTIVFKFKVNGTSLVGAGQVTISNRPVLGGDGAEAPALTVGFHLENFLVGDLGANNLGVSVLRNGGHLLVLGGNGDLTMGIFEDEGFVGANGGSRALQDGVGRGRSGEVLTIVALEGNLATFSDHDDVEAVVVKRIGEAGVAGPELAVRRTDGILGTLLNEKEGDHSIVSPRNNFIGTEFILFKMTVGISRGRENANLGVDTQLDGKLLSIGDRSGEGTHFLLLGGGNVIAMSSLESPRTIGLDFNGESSVSTF